MKIALLISGKAVCAFPLFPSIPLIVITGLYPNELAAQCSNAPDLIIANANILTMDPQFPEANAITIKEGIITAVGTFNEIFDMMPDHCPVTWIDASDFTILPGFNDSHTHWLSWPEHICDAPGQEETTYPPLDVIMETLSANGWTSISELNFGRPALIPEHLQHAMELQAAGNLNVRLNGYWGTYDHIDLLDELDDYGYGPGHVFSDRIRAPGVKMYVDDPFGTTDIMDQATCTALVNAAHDAGYQVAAHCVNESAIEKIVTAYESALGSSGKDIMRHRIEHAVKVNDDQFNRIEAKDILLSFQLLGPPDWPEQTTFQTYLSNNNTQYLLRWKDFAQSSTPITGSTDAPFNNSVCDYSPFRAIYQAVTRKGYIDRTHAAWELNQRISIADGMKLLTVDGAYATGEEDVKGSLSADKYADLVIITQDPLALQDPEQLLSIHPVLTMVGGETEYCDDGFAAGCDPATAFKMDTQLVIASHYTEGQPATLAFDMDEETAWLSGDFAPQYIEVDLLQNTALDRIELVVEQFPSGFTRHALSGAPEGQMIAGIHEFAGTTQAGQVLTYQFQSSDNVYRKLRITTLESPSWVAWKEIRLIKSSQTSTTSLSSGETFHIYPNPAHDLVSVSFDRQKHSGALAICINSLDGKTVARISQDTVRVDGNKIDIALPCDMAPGIYWLQITSGTSVAMACVVIQ